MSGGVFVLGMHRSGTSAAARLVNLLGVPTCIEEDLLRTTTDNPRGFWESASMTALNDRLLATLGCDWTCPPVLDAGWETEPELDELRAEAATRFAEVFPTSQWVWKDPRNCLTLPFWAHCLGVRPVVVLVHRNPLEIAASLAVRDDLGRLTSLALWERYLRACFASVSGLPVLLTDYAELVADPVGWCERARGFLSRAGIETTSPSEEDVRGFVDADLRHESFTADEVRAHACVSEEQRRLFDILEEEAGAHDSFSVADPGPESRFTDALLAERRRIHVTEEEHGQRFAELEEYSADLGKRFLELEDHARSLQERHDALEDFARGLQERYAALEEYARGLQQRFSA